MEKTVVLQVKLLVHDASALFELAKINQGTPVETLEEAICEAVTNPTSAPLDVGFEIVSKSAHSDGNQHILFIECRVFDEAAMLAEAQKRFAACWLDTAWTPNNQEEALFEILIGSNGSPPPCDIGFELVDWKPLGVKGTAFMKKPKGRQLHFEMDSVIEHSASVLLGLAMLAVWVLLVGWMFSHFNTWLQHIASATTFQSAMAWEGLGIVCAAYWPIRYRRAMRGLWREAIPYLVLLSLTGPLALALGFPL